MSARCFDFAYKLMTERDGFWPSHFTIDIEAKQTMWWYSMRFFDRENLDTLLCKYETYSEKCHFHHYTFEDLLSKVKKISNRFEQRGLVAHKFTVSGHYAGIESNTIDGLMDGKGVCENCHTPYQKNLNYEGNLCEHCAILAGLTQCALCGKKVNDKIDWHVCLYGVDFPRSIRRFCDRHRIKIAKKLFKRCGYDPSPEDDLITKMGYISLHGKWKHKPTDEMIYKFVEQEIKLFAKRLSRGEIAGYCSVGGCIKHGRIEKNEKIYCAIHRKGV